MKIAFLFAGQGSQMKGMGVELAESCDDCRATLDTADHALGYPLSRIMAEGPEEALRQTAITQPAVVTLAVAHARHLVSMGIVPDVLAGHSVGQATALIAAGALDFADGVRLVAERGRLMQATVPEGEGSMAAIVGIDRSLIYEICEATRPVGVVNVACHNAPKQTVISGAWEAVAAASELCEEEGGGAIPLAVSAPFHCHLLEPMLPAFTALIDGNTMVPLVVPVIDNVTARPIVDAGAARRSLVEQIVAPVLWEESLLYLAEMGVTHFIQCGPGKSLLSFVKRTIPGASVETFEEAARSTALAL